MPKRNCFCILVLYLLGSSIIYIGNIGYHTHLALLSSLILFLPLIFLFNLFLKKFPNQNLFTMLGNNIFSMLLSIIIIIYCFFLGGRTVFRYVDFLISTSLFLGNRNLFLLSIVLVLIVIGKIGVKNFGRLSQIAFFFVIVSIVFLFLLGIPTFKFSNIFPLYPVYTNDYLNNLKTIIIEPFFESFLLLNIYSYSDKKSMTDGYFTGFSILLIIVLSTLMSLGATFMIHVIFPYYLSLSTISSFGFLNRIEVIGIIIYYFSCMVKLGVIIFSINMGINHVFKTREDNYFITPIVLIIVLISTLFKSIYELNRINYLYLYSCFMIVLFMSLFILLRRKDKKKGLTYEEK